jgi:hypothetical protein
LDKMTAMHNKDKRKPQAANRKTSPLQHEVYHRRYRSLLARLAQPEKERGQSIIIIAVAFIGLLAFIGLAVDFGILLIGMGHLKRGIDSASLAAATQYRNGIDSVQISDSANEFLRLNGVDLGNITSHVETCATAIIPNDAALCTNPPRKLVRITADADVSFVFLPLLGIDKFTISASSIAEAASMDVVLVIDISESMTFNSSPSDPNYDPSKCNPTNLCSPFRDVKSAAKQFADQVLNKPAADEEDRLSIVIFSDGWEADKYGTQVIDPCGSFYNGGGCPPGPGDPGYDANTYNLAHSGWMSSTAQADAVIDNLEVYTPPACLPRTDPDYYKLPGTCRTYTDPNDTTRFTGMTCPWSEPVANGGQGDYSTCTTTNIGGGLKLAGQMYDNGRRPDALWITILLTDGAANATQLKGSDNLGLGNGVQVNPTDPMQTISMVSSVPVGFCPENTFIDSGHPFCRNTDVMDRHPASILTLYDADDYAKDQADFVGCSGSTPAALCYGRHGQGALVFAIGLGDQVLTRSIADGFPYGDFLLRYIAAVGDDGDPATDPCSTVIPPALPLVGNQSYQCGNYYFAQYSGILSNVFSDIFNRIYTRITQ